MDASILQLVLFAKTFFSNSPDETMAIAAEIGADWTAGIVVKLEGELGAGKTTFVRGVLKGLGYEDAVKSPTFNILSVFETTPPVAHLDLYRLASHEGLGLEDLLDTHICLIEWPDRAATLPVENDKLWTITLRGADNRREIVVENPGTESV